MVKNLAARQAWNKMPVTRYPDGTGEHNRLMPIQAEFKVRPAHHQADGTFRNPPGSPERVLNPRQLWDFWLRTARQRRDKPIMPAGHVIPEAEALVQYHRHGDDSIAWLGHASFLIRSGGLTILTDPFLSRHAGPGALGPRRIVDAAISIAHLPPFDILVVSHNHYDHLDDTTIRKLPNKSGVTVVVPLGLGEFFRVRGYSKIVELDWYQYIHLGTDEKAGGVRLTALPVVHWSRRLGQDHNTTLWAGFSFKSKTRHIFFGGDSAYGAVFDEIGARFGPFDEALLGIGTYAPRKIMRAVHASPEEAVRMGLDLGAQRLIAMHWGTVMLGTEPPLEPPERFLAAGAAHGFDEDRLWVMSIGETRPLPPRAKLWPSNN